MKNITFTDSELKDVIELYESEIDRAQRRINSLQELIRKMRADSPAGEVAAKPAAKRGRPSKEKTAEAAATTPAPAAPAEAPQKRGRKPKAAATTPALATPAEAPKKRGRKPKAAAPALAPPTTEKATAKKTTRKATQPKRKTKAKAKATKYQAIKGQGGVKMKWTDTIMGVIKENAAPMTSSEIASRTIEVMGIESKDAARAKTSVATNLSKMVKEKVLIKSKSIGLRGSVYSAPNTSVVVNPDSTTPSYPTPSYSDNQQ
ncbi:MAG: hypothetical protein IJU72_01965 [Bacteroidales bacterium]|nr:hypothetical protein [Bacteroidales bacterium]